MKTSASSLTSSSPIRNIGRDAEFLYHSCYRPSVPALGSGWWKADAELAQVADDLASRRRTARCCACACASSSCCRTLCARLSYEIPPIVTREESPSRSREANCFASAAAADEAGEELRYRVLAFRLQGHGGCGVWPLGFDV